MKNYRMKNLTPHPINIIGYGEIEPEGIVPRAQQKETTIGSINGIPLVQISYGDVANMPEEEDGTIYIVSVLVAQALKGIRSDAVFPTDFVRDDNGYIIGCQKLGKL